MSQLCVDEDFLFQEGKREIYINEKDSSRRLFLIFFCIKLFLLGPLDTMWNDVDDGILFLRVAAL